MTIKAIYEKGVFRPLENVPLEEGTEVEVYASGDRTGATGEGNGRRPKSVKELGAYGMWKDREDIGTGVEYVNRIRRRRREPEK